MICVQARPQSRTLHHSPVSLSPLTTQRHALICRFRNDELHQTLERTAEDEEGNRQMELFASNPCKDGP